MSNNQTLENALSRLNTHRRNQRREMSSTEALSITDNQVVGLIQQWHDPADGLPEPSVTIPLLRKAQHQDHGFGSGAPWLIRVCLVREIARARAKKMSYA